MNVSVRWLQALVPGLTGSPQQLADRLAMQGAPVDEIIEIGAALRDIRVARVTAVARHPHADKLNLCAVDAGTGLTLQVVCGATNVQAGAYYPFAPVGAELPGGMSIGRRKIRGIESQGMLCSARELGLGRDHEGIMTLHGEFTPGVPFIEAVALDDVRLVVDVTPNRPDLLSHIGIARELAADEGLAVSAPALPGADQVAVELVTADRQVTADGITVTIEDAQGCPRYLGLVLRGVRVGPSPEWLAGRLRSVGLRPISNVVDATNYVLHEFGQPLHAFDLQRLGSSVVVRRARAGERITTLDAIDRALDPSLLVIASADHPVALAGVMGGAGTEVTAATTDLLLECALFDPRAVRATRRALGLGTDASQRFERGVDPDTMVTALERAASLIRATAGGVVAATAAAVGPGLPPVPPITLRLARVEHVLGERFVADRVQQLLRPLAFGVQADVDALRVTVPGHRRYDVASAVDLIEEVARRHGYANFSDELRPFRPSSVPDDAVASREARLRTLLVGRGLFEARTAAFAPAAEGDVPLLLPLAATESRLRRDLLPGLLHRVEANFARGTRHIRLFEIGTVFAPPADPGVAAREDAAVPGASGLPREFTRLAVAVTGARTPPHWSQQDTPPFDIWDLKGLLAEVAVQLGLEVRVESAPHPCYDPAASFLVVAAGGRIRGVAGRILAGRVDAPAWAEDIFGFEVDILPIPADARSLTVAPLPAFPAVERDLALIVPNAVPAAAVLEAVRAAGVPLLEEGSPFDLYTGAGVPPDTRSLAVRLRFRAPDRTLVDAEVDEVVGRILRRLQVEHGIQKRT